MIGERALIDVAERLKLARPVMRGGAGFDADQTRRQLLKERQTYRRFIWRRMITLPFASTPWIWKTDFAMSRPIVVTSMTSSSSSGSLDAYISSLQELEKAQVQHLTTNLIALALAPNGKNCITTLKDHWKWRATFTQQRIPLARTEIADSIVTR